MCVYVCVCLSDGNTPVSKKGTLGGKTASVEATSVSGGWVEGQINPPKTSFVPCQGSNWTYTQQYDHEWTGSESLKSIITNYHANLATRSVS